jgi:hypothetical protein
VANSLGLPLVAALHRLARLATAIPIGHSAFSTKLLIEPLGTLTGTMLQPGEGNGSRVLSSSVIQLLPAIQLRAKEGPHPYIWLR